VRLFAEAAGGSAEGASRAAAALELVHTYSLVHDDLPCMDDDDLRRGRPTCHKVYGEALAVLVGDALLTRAFEVLAGAKGASAAGALQVLARAAGGAGMVGGQVLDMTVEASGASPEDVRDLQRKKTGALLGAACELGALTGGASPVACAGARDFGEALGLAFQVVDDALDITGDAVTLGKTPGKDQALGRATSVTVMGLEGARGEATRRAAAAREAALGLGFLESSLVLRLVEHLGSRSR
ncbi:MAG: polyprenyl synthetase family protein, partial [bacterium]